MGSTERRERQKQELRQKILEAARELFLERGYEAVTMREIAHKIEYSPTAIYLHFKDKTALVTELVGSDFRALAAEFQRIAQTGGGVARLRETGRAYIRFGLTHPNHYRTMFMGPPAPAEAKSHDDAGDPQRDGYAFMRNLVAEAMQAGELRPDVVDVELVAQTLWAGVHGVVSLRIARGCDTWIGWREADALADAMLDVLMRGLVRDPDNHVKGTRAKRPQRRTSQTQSKKRRRG